MGILIAIVGPLLVEIGFPGMIAAPVILFIIHKISIISPVFVMINVIVTIWMFCLYIACVSAFYNILFDKSIFAIVISFVLILIITALLNKFIGLKSIPLQREDKDEERVSVTYWKCRSNVFL